MVDLSDYLERDGDEPSGGDAEDFAALKACLKALADAVASTNLAVLTGARGDVGGAGARVQASVEALRRFSEAYAVLDAGAPEAGAAEDD